MPDPRRGPHYPLGRTAYVCRPCRLPDTDWVCPRCGRNTTPTRIYNKPAGPPRQSRNRLEASTRADRLPQQPQQPQQHTQTNRSPHFTVTNEARPRVGLWDLL